MQAGATRGIHGSHNLCQRFNLHFCYHDLYYASTSPTILCATTLGYASPKHLHGATAMPVAFNDENPQCCGPMTCPAILQDPASRASPPYALHVNVPKKKHVVSHTSRGLLLCSLLAHPLALQVLTHALLLFGVLSHLALRLEIILDIPVRPLHLEVVRPSTPPMLEPAPATPPLCNNGMLSHTCRATTTCFSPRQRKQPHTAALCHATIRGTSTVEHKRPLAGQRVRQHWTQRACLLPNAEAPPLPTAAASLPACDPLCFNHFL